MRATHAVDRVRVAIQVAAMDLGSVGLRKTPARPNLEPNIRSRRIPTQKRTGRKPPDPAICHSAGRRPDRLHLIRVGRYRTDGFG
jgi:hypothetical protein